MDNAPFSFDMKIDDNGMVLVTATGQLDADVLIRQRAALAEQGLTGESAAGRPLVIDLRESDPPDTAWMGSFRKIAVYLKDTGEYPYRRAYVVAATNSHEFAIKLLQVIEETEGAPEFETRVFFDYADAYAWAKSGWNSGEATAGRRC
ncbi:MAG: hypothetical protein RJQ21_15270 [Rhodospirillales bacterium]